MAMNSRRSLGLRLSFAAILALFLTLPAVWASASAHSRFAGMYESHTGKNGPYMSLSLGANGTATLTEDPGTGTLVFFGHWADSGAGVTLRFDPTQGKPTPAPMTFRVVHDGLRAATWNHALWGKVVPPRMKKGTSVKEMYWFTTVR